MADILQWIQQMQEKYAASAQTDGPTVHAVPPSHQRYGLQPEQQPMAGQPQMEGQGTGLMYTGRGPVDEPAGIVDRGEMVVESNMVQDLGGPQSARAGIEKLRDMKTQGKMPSFQEGTGDQTAGDSTTRTQEDLNLPKAPEVKTADQVTSGMATRDPSQYESITKEGVAGLQSQAKGESPAMNAISETAKSSLAGSQAVRGMGQAQQAAQAGLEGGTARAAQAMERRQAGIETSNLEGQLAVEKAQRQERAQNQLVQAGLQGQQLEEAKHQFDVGVQKWGQEFEEASKQWGANFQQRQAEFTETANQWGKDFALAQEKFNYGKAQDTIRAQLVAGDFDGAAATYANLGVNINLDSLKDAKTRDDIGNYMSDFSDFAQTFGENSPQAQGALQNVYKLQNPGVDVSTPEGKAKMDEWVKNSADSYAIRSSPYRSALESMFPTDDPATAEKNSNLLASSFGIDMGTFEFNGSKGEDAMKDWYTAYLMNPAAMNDTNSALYKAVNPSGENSLTTEQAGYNLETDDPFGEKADQILSQKRTAENSTVFDSIVKSRADKFMKPGEDTSGLMNKDINDPVVKEVLKRSPVTDSDSNGKFHGTARNRTYELKNQPEVGSVINYNGAPYKVKSYGRGFQDIRGSTADKDFQTMTVTNLLTGKDEVIEAKHDYDP